MKQILITEFDPDGFADVQLYLSSDEVWEKQTDGSFKCKKSRTGDVSQHNPGTTYTKEAFIKHLEAKRIMQYPLTPEEAFKKPKQIKKGDIRKLLREAWKIGFNLQTQDRPITPGDDVDEILETFLKNKLE